MRSPALPPGRTIDLPGRGTTFIRECGSGEHTLLLLHGWTASADLHWYEAYGALGTHFRVIAIDQRAHGQGIRSRSPFTLEACADDVESLCAELDIDKIVPVGFSMGGLVAQLLWHRHRSLVAGLVLAGTSADLRGNTVTRLINTGVSGWAAAGRLIPKEVRQVPFDILRAGQLRIQGVEPWQAEQRRALDVSVLAEGAAAIGAFSSSHWVSTIDVPTSVVAFTEDDAISPSSQRRLAESIPDAALFECDGAHHALTRDAERAVPLLVDAVSSVTERLHHRP